MKGEDHVLSLSKNEPNPACLVGRQINDKLTVLMDDIDHAIISKLKHQTLEQFKNQF